MLLKDKVVIITGASRGIGRACAVVCAREGASVVLNYFEKADKNFDGESAIVEAVKEVEKLGGKAVAVEGDVADPTTGKKLVDAAVESFGKVDALVANAGICIFHSFVDMPPEIYKKVMDVNMGGAFFATQAVAKRLIDQGHGGAIVAISSISALLGGEFQTHYCPTKSGVHSLMQSVAIALGPHKIRCNSIMPGTIETDINKEDLSNEEKRVAQTKRVPLGRLGKPEDVAECVAFLLSDRAAYVNGASLLVDGGMYVNLQ